MASPAAVVRILTTQNMAVISGTFAAKGCCVKRRNSERTLGVSLSGFRSTAGDVGNRAT